MLLEKSEAHSFNLRSHKKKHVLEPPFSKYWADPFIIVKGCIVYVYFEEYDLAKNIGCIKLITVNGDIISQPVDVITEPFHLSFPFIYEVDGNFFMIPEAHESKQIRLYECVDFPRSWNYVGNLIEDIDAVDTVVFTNKDGAYMLTSGISDEGVDKRSALYVYHNSCPNSLGGWSYISDGPVYVKSNGGRNAGKVLNINGSYFRVGQNNTRTYGEWISVFEILSISNKNYKEVLCARIKPKLPFELKIHTYNVDGNYIVYDREILKLKYLISVQCYRIMRIFKKLYG